jgi:predicted metal-dependent hydrolase
MEDGKMKMYVRPGSTKAKRQEFLDKWYGKILKDAVLPLIENWERTIGVEVKKLYVRKMKTHWGSCNGARQTIRLNSELAKRKPECLEYVVVHEMTHIIEKSHNRNFYSLLNKYYPAWKTIRKKMNSGDL